ncbi:uncharacterized protein LOC121387456 [Gigantopelta aegis]|uniref:uncharacterized protein LOC121387456 n=1 Tax=Gigantopelta aegis TaxID=1735272 RepID=UPI001B8898D5|nr:uncharacterized protein LOC121387456 [Gigantopelta aegis]
MKYDGTVLCKPDFCFFETEQATECKTNGCGECKQIEWRNMTESFVVKLPAPLHPGWNMTWRATQQVIGNGRLAIMFGEHLRMEIMFQNALDYSVSLHVLDDGSMANKVNITGKLKQGDTLEVNVAMAYNLFQVMVKGNPRKPTFDGTEFSLISKRLTEVSFSGSIPTKSLKVMY